MAEFTHFNESGRARMVDVSAKAQTERVATAQAKVYLQPETLEKIQRGKIAKGRCTRRGSSGRRHGGQKDPRVDSHVPSDSSLGDRYLVQGRIRNPIVMDVVLSP